MTSLNQLLQALNTDLGAGLPRRVGVRQLNQETGRVLNTLRDRNETAVITYRGVPSFLLVPIQPHELATLVLANGPDLWAEDMAEATTILAKELSGDQSQILRPQSRAKTPAADLQSSLREAVEAFDPGRYDDINVVGVVDDDTADATFAPLIRTPPATQKRITGRSAKA